MSGAVLAGFVQALEEIRKLQRQVEELTSILDSHRILEPRGPGTLAVWKCEPEIERLKNQIREGNARFDATVERVVAERLETQPDLLAALRLILESFTEPEDDNEILRQARAAIAKAEGRRAS